MVKTKLRLWVVVVAALVVMGGVAVATKEEKGREVKFYAHWRPVYAKADRIQYGPKDRLLTVDFAQPTFRRTDWIAPKSIAALYVSVNPREDIRDLTCNIQVGKEAPKWGVPDISHGSCRVEKYVN